jgi:hypothetical protein
MMRRDGGIAAPSNIHGGCPKFWGLNRELLSYSLSLRLTRVPSQIYSPIFGVCICPFVQQQHSAPLYSLPIWEKKADTHKIIPFESRDELLEGREGSESIETIREGEEGGGVN